MIEDERKYEEAEVAEHDRQSIGAAAAEEEEEEAKCEECVRKTLLPRKPEILETSMINVIGRAAGLAKRRWKRSRCGRCYWREDREESCV